MPAIPVTDPSDDFVAMIEAAIADATAATPTAVQLLIAVGDGRRHVRLVVSPRPEPVSPRRLVDRLADMISDAASSTGAVSVLAVAHQGREVLFVVAPEAMAHRFADPHAPGKGQG